MHHLIVDTTHLVFSYQIQVRYSHKNFPMINSIQLVKRHYNLFNLSQSHRTTPFLSIHQKNQRNHDFLEIKIYVNARTITYTSSTHCFFYNFKNALNYLFNTKDLHIIVTCFKVCKSTPHIFNCKQMLNLIPMWYCNR